MDKPNQLLTRGPDGLSQLDLLQEYESIRLELLQGNERTQLKLLQNHKTSAGYVPHLSKSPLDSLKRITISELSTNTVHHGRVLVCRTVADPINFVAVQTLIEDPIVGQGSTAVARLSLYKFTNSSDPHYDVSNILPLGARLFIKEPYYSSVQDGGGLIVRCDSPDDVIVVPNEQVDGLLLAGLQWSDMLPINYGPTIKHELETADTLKQRGNKQFARKDYTSAIKSYTHALKLDPKNAVLLLNRAQAHLHLEQFGLALNDAKAALKIDGANTKALFRQAKASYGLRSYQNALDVLKKLNATTAETQELYRRIEQRLKEQRYGQYDITSLIREAQSTKPPYLDHADYIGPVRITEIPGKGRGIVAKEEIAEGTLLLCSKAFVAVFGEQLPATTGNSPIHTVVTEKIVCKLKKEPWTASELYSLYAGPSMPPIPNNPTKSKHAQIDLQRITNIVGANCTSAINLSQTFAIHPCEQSIFAIWTYQSYINHSCLANASFVNIGDLSIVRAIRGIAKGEEICGAYVPPYRSYDKREKALQERNFKCQCLLCEFERAHPEVARRRTSLLDEFDEMKKAGIQNNITLIPRLKNITDELRKTYQTVATTINTNTSTKTTVSHRDKGKKAITASTGVTSDFLPHQLKFGIMPPLFALSTLYAASGQRLESLQMLIEVLEIPRTGTTACMNAHATDLIGNICKVMKSAEADRWLQLSRKANRIAFGVDELEWLLVI